MRRRRFHGIFAASVFVACAIPMGLSQTSQNSAMFKVDLSSSSRAELEAAIRKTIEDEDSAYARLDGSAALSYTSDDEGMFYDRDSGRIGSQAFKQTLANAFALAKSDPRKYEYEITKLYVLPLAPDITLANYVLIIKITLDGKTEMNRQANTDVFVLRDGR